jgi:hypothetical protein
MADSAVAAIPATGAGNARVTTAKEDHRCRTVTTGMT